MLDVDTMLKEYFQNTDEANDKPLMRAASSVLKKLFHQKEINAFIETHQYLEGLEFNDAVLEHFNFTFQVFHFVRMKQGLVHDQGHGRRHPDKQGR